MIKKDGVERAQNLELGDCVCCHGYAQTQERGDQQLMKGCTMK